MMAPSLRRSRRWLLLSAAAALALWPRGSLRKQPSEEERGRQNAFIGAGPHIRADRSHLLLRRAEGLPKDRNVVAAADELLLLEDGEEVQAERAELQKAADAAREALDAAEAKLRRAQAFKLPEQTELRAQVEALRSKAAEADAKVQGSVPGLTEELAAGAALPDLRRLPETDAEWEALAKRLSNMEVQERYDLGVRLGPKGRAKLDELEAKLESQATASTAESSQPGTQSKAPLSERLNWDKFQAMSNEEKMALTQELGPAFGASVAIVALCYWSITLPLLLNAYRESTGEWPKLEELFTLSDGGKAAGAVAGVLGITALLKPLRIAIALAITPWTAENVLPLLPSWLTGQQQADTKQDGQRK